MSDRTSRSLEAQAAAFAQILAATDDTDVAFRQAAALADGLFPHQVEGVAFLLGRRRAILADDMGLGKTRQALAALSHAAPAGQVLIVCPASVKRNWAREISLAAVEGSVHIMEGTARQRIPRDARWVVANYDILGRHVDAIGAVPWAGLIFDEAHYLKNHTSARSKVARELAEQGGGGREAGAARVSPDGHAVDQPAARSVRLAPARRASAWTQFSLVRQALLRRQEDRLRMEDRRSIAPGGAHGAAPWDDAAARERGGSFTSAEVACVAANRLMRQESPPKRCVRSWTCSSPAPLVIWKPAISAPANAPARDPDESEAEGRLAKVPTTLELVRGAVEQGEKVIVFSCFEDPLQHLADAFGSAAVVLTGKVPSGQRQRLVDRFQQDDDVRVFLANIIAGGTGVTLTAATQVIFNDLDWVPANHWQAEDRAYRIGQTRTVNVTYVVGVDTVDEFVQAVLETKTALVRSVVEGEALAGDGGGAVLEELERAIAAMSPGLADARLDVHDQDVINGLVRAATEQWRNVHAVTAGGKARAADPATIRSLRSALEMLARVLAGPRAKRFRIASSSNPGSHYFVDVDGSDVICSCPGFEYRGQCKHARDVKSALASGHAPPTEYVAIE